MHDETEEQDDFGATRAGDFGATSALPNSRPPARPSFGASAVRGPTGQYPLARRPSSGAATPPAAMTPPPPGATTRYCGTCGAPLEPGRAYCGQCGTPVSTSGVHSSDMNPSPSSSSLYRSSSVGWADDGDAPTVAELPMEDLYGSYAGRGPISTEDTSRTLRIMVGILCLVGSFATAIAAIVLALATFH